MRWTGHRYRSRIGLDLGAHWLKAVQLVGQNGKWDLAAVAMIPKRTPGPVLELSDLQRLVGGLARQGFKGTQVTIAGPPAKMMTGVLELPAPSEHVPMDEVSRAEFSRINNCESTEVTMSYWDLPAPARATRSTYAMAVGCLSKDIIDYIDLVESTGLSVETVDASASATARACMPVLEPGSNMTAILDLGWSASVLGIVKSGILVYERKISEGGLANLIQSVSSGCGIATADAENLLQMFGLDKVETERLESSELNAECRNKTTGHFSKLLDELRQAFSYVAHQYSDCSVDALILTGGGSRMSGIAAFIEGALKIPVRTIEAGDVVGCTDGAARSMNSSVLTAVGLAQFEASES